uniref:Probable ATP-dependent transporter ycf16 n=1 Tax=Taenioma perpusillum TaxID=210852 RepID=A0A1Z1MRV3_9FLOR|nr:Iron-sulfur cluster formation ABC transporterATP-binding subunit [Taenioma perpusillum]ARW68491.1 Iron-sulfur cluster formation ABC transporterATP-binding subunit [Taenioma perpusillum]
MTKKNILEINNLSVSVDKENIIKNLNLRINSGEIHAIMGKNGSGKSTLAKVIAGHPNYKINNGSIYLTEENITNKEADKRAHKGIFLGFQYPVEIPGVSNLDFLRLSYNSIKKANKQKELDPLSFYELVHKKAFAINMKTDFLNRNVNEGFSGGEKKKNEILQMSLLDSKIFLLDEIDSGLDIDALKDISLTINQLKTDNNCLLIITHYQKFLDYIKPDYIHIMDKGEIIYTGNSEIAKKIDSYGYDSIIKEYK